MPVEALLLPLRMPLFCSFEIIALVGCGIMDALLHKYEMKFGECFPLMLCRHMTDTEICEMVQQCLDSNEPYNPELDPDADY